MTSKTQNGIIDMMVVMRFIFAIVVVLVSVGFANPQEPKTRLVDREHEIKAAYLFHFSSLIEWPAESLPKNKVFVVAVVGQDPLLKALDTIKGKVINLVGKRTIVIESYKSVDEINTHCQILYVSRSMAGKSNEIFNKTKDKNILVVSDLSEFASSWGTIEFQRNSNKIRFEISNSNAKRNGLRISARLLRLASQVR